MAFKLLLSKKRKRNENKLSRHSLFTLFRLGVVVTDRLQLGFLIVDLREEKA